MEAGYGLCAVFAPGNRHAVVGTKEGTLEVFDLGARTRVHVEAAHAGAVWSLALLPDRSGFVSGSADKTVKFWTWASVAAGGEGSEGVWGVGWVMMMMCGVVVMVIMPWGQGSGAWAQGCAGAAVGARCEELEWEGRRLSAQRLSRRAGLPSWPGCDIRLRRAAVVCTHGGRAAAPPLPATILRISFIPQCKPRNQHCHASHSIACSPGSQRRWPTHDSLSPGATQAQRRQLGVRRVPQQPNAHLLAPS